VTLAFNADGAFTEACDIMPTKVALANSKGS